MRRRIRPALRAAMLGLTALLLQIVLRVPALAAGIGLPDLNAGCSIVVSMRDGEGKAVPGGTFAVFCVAAVQADDADLAYVYTEEFAECGFSLESLSEAGLADALADWAAQIKPDGVVSIGTDGDARSSELVAPGLYLLVQTEAAGGYEAVSPFLVSAPMATEAGWIYAVDASPKVELCRQTPPTPTPPPALPQTGRLNWLAPVLAAGGLLLFAAGWYVRFVGGKKRRDP